MKKNFTLLGLLLFITSCEEIEDIAQAIAETSCYCEDATTYYDATILTDCDPGFSFQCYPLGEVPTN